LQLSIANLGQLSPIKVRPNPSRAGRFELIFGYRRLQAMKALKETSVNAEIIDASDEDMIAFALAENLDRDNYSDYEQALLFFRLRKQFGKSIEEIASLVGKSSAYVSQHLAMVNVFECDRIRRHEAENVLKKLTDRLDDPEERFNLAKMVVANSLGLKELEMLVGRPRTLRIWAGSERKNWRQYRASAERAIIDVIKLSLEGASKKDLRPLLSSRIPEHFSLFDDFPPLDLLDYEKAADHNAWTIRHTENLELTYDNLRIHVFGAFAYATFFVTYKILSRSKWYVMRSRVTFIFILKEGSWKIVHEHWSPAGYEGLYDFKNLEPKQLAVP
jgi:ParB/RepB/Spo0J family partition protein